MNRLLSALSANLLIENAGHRFTLSGGDMIFVARFPSLSSLLHFSRIFWSLRKRIPPGLTLKVQWRALSFVFRPSAPFVSNDAGPVR